ncbi:MAG TPA: hypothetical protein VIO14_13625 [Dehalococcoidia bacterium]
MDRKLSTAALAEELLQPLPARREMATFTIPFLTIIGQTVNVVIINADHIENLTLVWVLNVNL